MKKKSLFLPSHFTPATALFFTTRDRLFLVAMLTLRGRFVIISFCSPDDELMTPFRHGIALACRDSRRSEYWRHVASRSKKASFAQPAVLF